MKKNKIIVLLLLIPSILVSVVSLSLFNGEKNSLTEKPISVIEETANVHFVPWSTNFEGLSVIDSALKNTDSYFGTVNPSNLYEITVDKSFPSSELTWIKEMLGYVNGSMAKIKDNNIKVFVSDSGQWAKKTLESSDLWLGDPNGNYPCSGNTPNEVSCAQDNLVLLSFYDIEPNHDWYIQRRSIPAHEIFHIVQDSLSGIGVNVNPNSQRAIPAWLIEGSANYYGFYVVHKMGFNDYKESRSSRSWYDYSMNAQTPLSKYNNYSLDPYTIGQSATEYLIASAGFESLINIFKYSKTEKTFPSAFKKAVGISLEEFYSKFELSRSLMYVG
jgi:hypothetical protein